MFSLHSPSPPLSPSLSAHTLCACKFRTWSERARSLVCLLNTRTPLQLTTPTPHAHMDANMLLPFACSDSLPLPAPGAGHDTPALPSQPPEHIASLLARAGSASAGAALDDSDSGCTLSLVDIFIYLSMYVYIHTSLIPQKKKRQQATIY